MYYEKVELQDGEPIQYVGTYVLRWRPEWGTPDVGFREASEDYTTSDSVPDSEESNLAEKSNPGKSNLSEESPERPPIEELAKSLHCNKELDSKFRAIQALLMFMEEWNDEQICKVCGNTYPHHKPWCPWMLANLVQAAKMLIVELGDADLDWAREGWGTHTDTVRHYRDHLVTVLEGYNKFMRE